MKTDANQEGNSNDNREKERDRRGRGAGRGTRFSDANDGGNGGNGNRDRSREKRNNCRVYISNIPYDFRWQELKDLFRRIIGSVEYVELFHDENGKQRGCGMVQFKEASSVEKAIEKMNRYKINGRELVVKEDHGEPRDECGRIISGGNRGGDRDGYSRRDDDIGSGRNNYMSMGNDFNNSSGNYNYYGLSASFLESLGITGPLHNKVFVANLDYKVDAKKLKQVFKLAGKVQSVDLSVDKDGASRGFAVIEYDHPVEAVQAISMLDRQMLYERRMTVRLDRIPDKGEGLKLPEGLGGVGIGLGPSGEPLKDVARNLPNMLQNQQSFGAQCTVPVGNSMLMGNSNLGMGGNSVGNTALQPAPAPVTAAKPQQNILGNTTGGLNLGNLSTSNLAALGAALSNPLLTSSLSSLGLSLGQGNSGLVGGGNNDDSMPSGNAGLSNNYSTGGGNSYNSGGFGASGGFNAGSMAGNMGGGGLLENDYKTGNMDLFGGGSSVSNAGNMGVAANSRKSDTIIVKNLPLSCTWQTLRDKFREIGEVKFAEIRGNDVGIVRFFKERDAEVGIALMDGSRIDGRTIKVGYL